MATYTPLPDFADPKSGSQQHAPFDELGDAGWCNRLSEGQPKAFNAVAAAEYLLTDAVIESLRDWINQSMDGRRRSPDLAVPLIERLRMGRLWLRSAVELCHLIFSPWHRAYFRKQRIQGSQFRVTSPKCGL